MTAHTHTDDRLTFGCEACVADRKRAERQALLDEQPLRPIKVEWTATKLERGVAVIEAKYLDDEKLLTVASRYENEVWKHISRSVDFDPDDWDIEEVSVDSAPTRPQPSPIDTIPLFGAP